MPDTPEFEPIDLINPTTVFVNRLPDMSGVVERLFRYFRTQLFQEFRFGVEIQEGKFQIVNHDAYLAPRDGYHLFAILNLSPIRGLSLVTLDGALLAALVDDLFGADAPAPEDKLQPQISNMEARIGRRLIEMIGPAISAAFQQYFVVQPEVVRTEGFAALASVGDAVEPFCKMSAQVSLPAGGGTISIAIPYRGLEPYREILGSPAGGQAELEARSRWTDHLSEAIEEVPVEIGFEIGTVSMSAGGLSALAVGDMLPLTFHRNARAVIGKTTIADISYGAVGPNYGVFFENDQQKK
ncbi:FliM/FliN family flagellar motor switch protein [Thioclava sp. 15-R06ZXC-3]|uniref:Flagellar motor switch protein FliM n=1 Tax=Thioclava arctica TaxID=3238301 RepID=A0ABV3TP35_9RHOB